MNLPQHRLARGLQGTPILVTGASGRIGLRLVLALVGTVTELRVLCRNTTHRWPAGVLPVVGDLARPETLIDACRGVHTIFHLASYSPAPGEPDPEENPLHDEVTVTGTRNLIAAADTAGVERLLFVSSTRAIDGSRTRYARAKQAAERSVEDAAASMSTVVLRLPPVYGFTHQGFVAEMLGKALEGRLPALPDFGDRRSLVHVEDVLQALLLAAGRPQIQGCWTVTDLQSYSMRRIYEAVQNALGREPAKPLPATLVRALAVAGEAAQRLSGRPMPINLERLRKLRESALFDGRPFAQESGFEPLYTLEKALPELVAERTGNQETPSS